MDEKTFRDELRYIRNAMRNVDVAVYADFAAPQIAEKMAELADLIDGYVCERNYTQQDFKDDVLSLLDFLTSDEVARFSDGRSLQLSMLQAALLNYVDSLDCFDVAQDD